MARKILVDHDFGGVARAIGLLDPASAQDAATKAYVDGAIEGIAWKDSVRAASTANVTVASPGATIDGVTLAANDRVLLKNQTTQTENGLYIWNGAAVPMTRALDASTFAEIEGAVVVVEEGTANVGSSWRQTAVNGTLGSTNVVWTAFLTGAAAASETTSGIAELATQAETDTGTDDLRIVTPLKLTTWSKAPKRFAANVGDAAATSIVVTHNLNTNDVIVNVWETGGNKTQVDCEIRLTSVNSVTLVFAAAPALNALRAVVLA